LTNSY